MKTERIERDLQKNGDKYAHQYSNEGFLKKVPQLARKGGIKAVAYANVLYYTLKAPTTPTNVKLSLIVFLGYFVAPIDLIPDLVLGIGFTDDIVVLGYGLTSLMLPSLKDYVTPAILKQAINGTKRVFPKEPEESIKNIINQFGFYEQI